jgi:hypothetical protein
MSTIAHASEAVAVWIERGRPARIVWRGDRYTVTDTPTPLAADVGHDALTHPARRLIGWRFQGTRIEDGATRVFDVRQVDDDRWRLVAAWDWAATSSCWHVRVNSRRELTACHARLYPRHSARLALMAKTRRRPRGSMIDPVAAGWEIERASKTRLEAIAENAGVSAAVMVEQIIEHTELTIQGVPLWWEPIERDGELPIDSA